VYTFTTIKNLHTDLNSGKISCVQLVEESIKAIEEKKQLNAFLEVFNESALAQAKLVDEKIKASRASASNSLGKLAGVVIGLKDNICYKGHKVLVLQKY
jgi:aspartyl-tRNA(Asn)/glutamyl-tRNA(Gln) amidotransferase subunit A